MPIIKTIDLVKRFRLGSADVFALNGVSLDVQEGEFIAVMGRSGSGKSTLLSVLGCLDRPTSGAVFLRDVEVSRLPERRLPQVRRAMLGFVFQNFTLIPTLTALENVLLPLRYARVPAREAGSRAQEALRRGDWSAYGEEQRRLEQALRELRERSGR